MKNRLVKNDSLINGRTQKESVLFVLRRLATLNISVHIVLATLHNYEGHLKIKAKCDSTASTAVQSLQEHREGTNVVMSTKREVKPVLPKTGQLMIEDTAEFVLCQPRLIPLKSFTLQKLESMLEKAQELQKEQQAGKSD